MSRSPSFTRRSLLCGFLIAPFSSMVVADDEKEEKEDDVDSAAEGVAMSLGYAWGAFDEFEEIRFAHGARADIAWTRIQVADEQSRALLEVQNGDAMVATWPQNRYHWNLEQLNYLNILESRKQDLHKLEYHLRSLDQKWTQLDEAARFQAQREGKAAIPLDRAGLLGEFQRLGDKKLRAYTDAELKLHDAAEESKRTPTVILEKAVARIRSRAGRPETTLKLFIADFKAFYKSKHGSSRKTSRPTRRPSRPAAKKGPAEPLAQD